MLQIKSNSKSSTGRFMWYSALALLFFGWSAGAGLCAEVAFEAARTVAERKLVHHVALYGSWNGHAAPVVAEGQAVRYENQVVAYNFTVEPSGHVLVAVDDAFSPILLYSERSRFDPGRAYDPAAIESWIVPEMDKRVGVLKRLRAASSLRRESSEQTVEGRRIKTAWAYYMKAADERAAAVSSDPERSADAPARSVNIGPLLSTAWGQEEPYNLLTPAGSTCAHTPTGCVATAWAQVLRYYQWPLQGTGDHSYPWNGTTLAVDFNKSFYQWDFMPGTLAGSGSEQQNAVALLMRDVGIAAEMNYACGDSGSIEYADDVLDTYFKYKAMERVSRTNVASSAAWLNYFQTEFDAGRPVVLSIFLEDASGGHEVVADGCQDDLIHVNYGWEGYQDGWYNITSDFMTEGRTWDASSQVIVIGIEPDRDGLRPSIHAGEDQIVNEGATVQLSGSVIDTAVRYQWRQVGIGDSAPKVSIQNADTLENATFRAPNVSTDTHLVFMLKATNANRSVGFDKVGVTVRNTGSSSSRSSGGGGGGGCFITSLH